jgi:hypothetical protein
MVTVLRRVIARYQGLENMLQGKATLEDVVHEHLALKGLGVSGSLQERGKTV